MFMWNRWMKLRTNQKPRNKQIIKSTNETSSDSIPLHAEVNELVDGRIKSKSILLLCQQLHLLNDMNPPTILQIWRVHVPNRVIDGLSLQKTHRSEILREPRHRPPPQLARVHLLASHRLPRRREQTVPVGRHLAAVREPENDGSERGGRRRRRRRVMHLLRRLPEHAFGMELLEVAPLLLFQTDDIFPAAGKGRATNACRNDEIYGRNRFRFRIPPWKRCRRRTLKWLGDGCWITQKLPHYDRWMCVNTDFVSFFIFLWLFENKEFGFSRVCVQREELQKRESRVNG